MNNLILKQELSAEQLAMVQNEVNKKEKSKGITLALWWFTGIFGGHRFYAGDTGYALGMLLTLGGFGFWTLIDVFFIINRIEKKNEQIEFNTIKQVKSLKNK